MLIIPLHTRLCPFAHRLHNLVKFTKGVRLGSSLGRSDKPQGKVAIPAVAQRVLEFWFTDLVPSQHWTKDVKLDETIRVNFGKTHEQAVAGDLADWQNTAQSCLALVIVLDQFSRNIYRDSPRAFSADTQALLIAKQAVERGFDQQSPPPFSTRFFFYLPFMHSEVLADQRRCVELYERCLTSYGCDEASKALAENSVNFAKRHLEIIEQFGRFPHRNAILGRTSTQDEREFLKQPGSSF